MEAMFEDTGGQILKTFNFFILTIFGKTFEQEVYFGVIKEPAESKFRGRRAEFYGCYYSVRFTIIFTIQYVIYL